jgi:YD repeat-containing protein
VVQDDRDQRSPGGDALRTSSSTYNNLDEEATQTDGNGDVTSQTYDAYGNAATETAPDGTQSTWTYDADGQVLTEGVLSTGSPLDPHAASLVTEQSRAYDPAGRLASNVDSMGNVTSYKYYDNGLKQSITRANGAGASSFVIESDTYDGAGNPVRKVANNGATTTNYTVDAADRTTTTVDDPGGAARTTTVSYTPDDQVATTSQTDPNGFNPTMSSSYDPMGNVLSQTLHGDIANHPTGWWPLNQTSGTTAADATGNGNTAGVSGGVTWSGGAASLDGTSGLLTNGPVLSTTSSFSVSAWVNLTSTSTFYTAVSQTGVNMGSFYLQYSKSANAWAFVRTASDSTSAAQASAKAATPPTLNTWTHLVGVFDSSTNAMTLYVNGSVAGTGTATTPWSGAGPLAIGGTKPTGLAASNFFAGSIGNVQVYPRVLSAGEVTGLFGAGRSSGTVASSSQLTTSRTLDKRGLPTSMTDPDGNVTAYGYDEAGQLAVTTDPTVSAESNGGAPVPVHPVQTTGYNNFGEPVESQDPNGNITTTVYDADGHDVSAIDPAYTPPGSSTPITATTVKTYDSLGELTSDSDGLNDTVHYVYDQVGDLVRETDPRGGNTDSTYDTNGDELSQTDPAGAQAQSTYDFLGRPLTSSTLERFPSAVT